MSMFKRHLFPTLVELGVELIRATNGNVIALIFPHADDAADFMMVARLYDMWWEPISPTWALSRVDRIVTIDRLTPDVLDLDVEVEGDDDVPF